MGMMLFMDKTDFCQQFHRINLISTVKNILPIKLPINKKINIFLMAFSVTMNLYSLYINSVCIKVCILDVSTCFFSNVS